MADSDPELLAPFASKLMQHSILNNAEISAILALPNRIRDIDPANYLVRQGDIASFCCILLSGFASRNKVTGDGSRQILSVHLRGDLVDFQNMFLEEADHNVQALTHVRAAFIPRQAISDLMQAYPAVKSALWLDTLVDGSIFREWLLSVGQRNALQRIAHLLCELALRQELAGTCKGPIYEWPMTQEQVGDATGLTAVHVNRMLKALRADGLINWTARTVTIIDWPGLRLAGDFTQGYLHLSTPSSTT